MSASWRSTEVSRSRSRSSDRRAYRPELGLGGDVRAVRGVLASAIAARDGGARLLLVPAANLTEAALVPGLRVAGASSLGQVGAFLRGEGGLDPPGPCRAAAPAPVEDLADV